MKNTAGAMAAVFTHYRIVLRFDISLNRGANISEARSCTNLPDAMPHRRVGDINQALSGWRDLADRKGAARVAMPALSDRSDIDVHNVALFQLFVRGNAM